MAMPNADFADEAAELMRKADAGDAEAQYNFATYLLKEKNFSYRKDLQSDEVKRGMDYLRKSAVQGYCSGLSALILGDIYYRGEIIAKDYKNAKLWYNTALLKNHPIASYMLGEYAYYGYDEDIDYKKAVEFYLRASRGYINAFIRIGDMYMRGEYLPYDPEFANKLYEHVLKEEEQLYKKHGFYSDAHKIVTASMAECACIKKSKNAEAAKETEEQTAARNKLLEIVNK